MTFSEKLQRLRKSGGYSQEELANELNVSRQAISKWEQGTVPDINNLLAISKFFDCSLDYLLNDAYEESKEKNEERVIYKRPVDTVLVLAIVGIVLSLLSFLTIYILSAAARLSFTRNIGGKDIYYDGICAFIEYYYLNALIIAQSVVFAVSFAVLAFKHKQKKKPLHTRKVLFYVGLVMMAVLVITATATLLTGGCIILENLTCILLSVYTCCAVMLTFVKLGGKNSENI